MDRDAHRTLQSDVSLVRRVLAPFRVIYFLLLNSRKLFYQRADCRMRELLQVLFRGSEMPPVQVVPCLRFGRLLRLVKLCFIHPEARLRRLLLNHKEPAIRIVRWLAECLSVTKPKAEKRDVRFQRASEKRMAFLRRVGRER